MSTTYLYTVDAVRRTVVRDGKLVIRFAGDRTPALRVAIADLLNPHQTWGPPLTAVQARTIGRLLARLALGNPTAGEWVTALDRHLGRTVGLENAAGLAERLWKAFGGTGEKSRSTRMRPIECPECSSDAWLGHMEGCMHDPEFGGVPADAVKVPGDRGGEAWLLLRAPHPRARRTRTPAAPAQTAAVA